MTDDLEAKARHVVHPLKCWTVYFDAIVSGEKPFEIRLDDRGFHTGDALRIQEWNPDRGEYTGREHIVEVTYLLRGSVIAPLIGLPRDIAHKWVVMGIRALAGRGASLEHAPQCASRRPWVPMGNHLTTNMQPLPCNCDYFARALAGRKEGT